MKFILITLKCKTLIMRI